MCPLICESCLYHLSLCSLSDSAFSHISLLFFAPFTSPKTRHASTLAQGQTIPDLGPEAQKSIKALLCVEPVRIYSDGQPFKNAALLL